MKKLFFLAIVLMIAGSVNAQHRWYRPQERSDDYYQVRVGLTGGLNFANTVSSDNPDFSTDTKTGFNAGLFVDIPIAYPLSIVPEVLYSQKGYRANFTDGSHFAQRANFVDVPILLKIKVAPVLNIYAGPQFSFLTTTRNTNYTGNAVIDESRYNYHGDKNFVDGNFGVGIDLNKNVELRGNYTIDFRENNPNGSSDIPAYRNQVWQVGLAFKL